MLEGPFKPNHAKAKALGFDGRRFEGYFYLDEKIITLSLVVSRYPRKGNFEAFVNNLLKQGFTVQVPTPLPQMRSFLIKHGFVTVTVVDPHVGNVELWVKRPSQQ